MDHVDVLKSGRRFHNKVNLCIETGFVRKLERPRGLNTVNDFIEAIEDKKKIQRQKLLHMAREPEFNPGWIDERAIALGEICTVQSSDQGSDPLLRESYAAGAADTSLEPHTMVKHLNILSSKFSKPGSSLVIGTQAKIRRINNKEKSKQSSRRSFGDNKTNQELLSRRLQDGYKSGKVKKSQSNGVNQKKSNQFLGKVEGLTFWPKKLDRKMRPQRNSNQRKTRSLSGSSCKVQLRIKQEQLSQPISSKNRLAYQRVTNGRELSIERSNSKIALKSLSSIFRKRKGATLLQQPFLNRRNSRPGSSIHLASGLIRRASKDPDVYFLRKPLIHQYSGASTKRLRCSRELEQPNQADKKTVPSSQPGRLLERSKQSLMGDTYVNHKDAILARLCGGISYNIHHSYSQNTSTLIAKSHKVPKIPAFSSRAPLVHPMKLQIGRYADKNARLSRQDINDTNQLRPRRFKGERVGSFLALNLAQCHQVWHPTRSKPDSIQTHR